MTFCVLVVVLTVAALGRVWLSAEAAQAALDSSDLREQIKIARFQGDMLEVQDAQLSSTTRIRLVASKTLGMAEAQKKAVVDIRPGSSSRKPSKSAAAPSRAVAAAPGVVDSLIGVAAGEARVLLVGDVGLASSR